LIKSFRVSLDGPIEDCIIVFIVFAGCITVCAILLETAPLTILSQKYRGRIAVAVAVAADPPRGVVVFSLLVELLAYAIWVVLFALVVMLWLLLFITEEEACSNYYYNDSDDDEMCFKCGFIVNAISDASSE
jgi:hypothetical protein